MTTADRMAVLDQGILQQVGTAAGLYDEPRNRFVAGFVGTANLLEGAVTALDGQTLCFDARGLGRLTLPAPAQPPALGAATLAFRPHQMHIMAAGAAGDAARVWLDGRVESAEFLGEFSRYRVRVGEVALTCDQPHDAGVVMFEPGAAVRLGIAPSQARYLSA